MRKTAWSLSEAKDHFSEVVDAARQGAPQTVTRHGKAVAVVVGVEDYERLKGESQPPRKSFVQHLLDMPKGDLEIEPLRVRPRDIEF